MIDSIALDVAAADVCRRIERFTSYGSPTCDICEGLSQEGRPEDGEFWPGEPIHYIQGNKDSAYEFWGTTVCSFHDDSEFHPNDMTHRVVNAPEYIGDEPDKMNSAYEHCVVAIEEMDK